MLTGINSRSDTTDNNTLNARKQSGKSGGLKAPFKQHKKGKRVLTLSFSQILLMRTVFKSVTNFELKKCLSRA